MTGSPAAGATIGKLHQAPLPGRAGPGRCIIAVAAELDVECKLLVTNGLLPLTLVTHNRQIGKDALRLWTPAVTHGDPQFGEQQFVQVLPGPVSVVPIPNDLHSFDVVARRMSLVSSDLVMLSAQGAMDVVCQPPATTLRQ